MTNAPIDQARRLLRLDVMSDFNTQHGSIETHYRSLGYDVSVTEYSPSTISDDDKKSISVLVTVTLPKDRKDWPNWQGQKRNST